MDLPRFKRKQQVLVTQVCFWHNFLVFSTYALVELKPYFPATNLKLCFKFVVACGFFREGVWGMTLFSPEKRVSPKKKGFFRRGL